MADATPSAPRSHSGARALRRAVAAAVAGVVLLVVAGFVWWRSHPDGNVGTSAVDRLIASPSAAASSATAPTRAAGLPTAAAPVVQPIRLVIPAIRLTATVRPAGVDASGDFDVPPDVDTVGWYQYGPGLDMAGSVVIAGHVDSADQGAGAFFRLRELGPGQPVTVTGDDGRARLFRVVAREAYPKAKIDLSRYFTSTGPPRLTLITCGGPFNEQTRHYRDNVVVTATPA